MAASSGWDSRLRRLRANGVNLAIALLAVVVVVVAVTKGVDDGLLSWADVIFIGVLIPSIMFHEVSHGVVALWCGDDTAKQAGRITANPIRHVDPIGTVLVPIAMVLLLHGAAFFGWAKPVPVRIDRLRHPRNQAVLVGLAGPLSNGLLALAAGIGLHFILAANNYTGYEIVETFAYFKTFSGGALYWIGTIVMFLGMANILVGAFNLLPIPPLDGAALLERLLPASALPTYYRFRMGFLVVVILFVYLDRTLLSTVFGDVATWYLNLVIR